MDWHNGEYVLTDEKNRLDLDAVCGLLRDTYWAADRSREVNERAFAHSVCFSLFHHGRQVGFARAVTDEATFTYLCDVIVAPEHRRRGLGQWMIRTMLAHPQLQTLTHALRTQDAHGLYARFGFAPAEYLRKSSRPL
jgi:GNAT superfamily N-acetyltransferase